MSQRDQRLRRDRLPRHQLNRHALDKRGEDELHLLDGSVMLNSVSSTTAQALSQDGWTATEVVLVHSQQEALERAYALS